MKVGDDIRDKHGIANLEPKKGNYRINVKRIKKAPKKQDSFRIHIDEDIEKVRDILKEFIREYRDEIFETNLIFHTGNMMNKTHQIQVFDVDTRESKTFAIHLEQYDYKEILEVFKQFCYDQKIDLGDVSYE